MIIGMLVPGFFFASARRRGQILITSAKMPFYGPRALYIDEQFYEILCICVDYYTMKADTQLYIVHRRPYQLPR